MINILIIDDEDQIRIFLKRVIESMGHNPILAADGEEGMEKFRQDPTPIVITDLDMPIKDGFEVIKEIRTEFPQTGILVISGGTSLINNKNNLLRTLEAGIGYCLTKPFEVAKFIEIVNILIQETKTE